MTASLKFSKTRQIDYFWHFYWNVNVARFARNIEWDFFCDFQTMWNSQKVKKSFTGCIHPHSGLWHHSGHHTRHHGHHLGWQCLRQLWTFQFTGDQFACNWKFIDVHLTVTIDVCQSPERFLALKFKVWTRLLNLPKESNLKLDKIENWTKLKTGQNRRVDKIENRTKLKKGQN